MKAILTAILIGLASPALGACPAGIDGTASKSLVPGEAKSAKSCTTKIRNGFPIPDPNCTPGAINPTLTIAVLRDSGFRTGCVRSRATSESQKNGTYVLYGVSHPANNSGANQTCELDHLISLELGGADTLDNIWPQCGPNGVALGQRYFKQKDTVEDWLAAQVRAGKIDLAVAQQGIASDWTQYLTQMKEKETRLMIQSPK